MYHTCDLNTFKSQTLKFGVRGHSGAKPIDFRKRLYCVKSRANAENLGNRHKDAILKVFIPPPLTYMILYELHSLKAL